MTSLPTSSRPMSPQLCVWSDCERVRTSPFSLPLLLLVNAGLMIGITRVADSWILALSITPLMFGLLVSPAFLLVYRRDSFA